MSLSLGFDCLSARLPVTNGKRQIVAPFNIATERANGQPRRLGTNYVGRAAIALAGTSGRSWIPSASRRSKRACGPVRASIASPAWHLTVETPKKLSLGGLKWFLVPAAVASLIALTPSPPGSVFLSYLMARWLAPAWAIWHLHHKHEPERASLVARASRVALALGLYAYLIVLGLPRSSVLVSIDVGPGAATYGMALPKAAAKWLTSSPAAPVAFQSAALKAAIGFAAAAVIKLAMPAAVVSALASSAAWKAIHGAFLRPDQRSEAAGKTVQASAEPDSTANVIIYREPQFEGEPSIPTNGQDDSAQADPAEDKEPAVPEGASSGLGTIQEGLGQVQQVLQRLEMLVKLRAPYGTPSKPCKEPMFGETVPLYAWLGQEHARLRSLQGMLRHSHDEDDKLIPACVDSLKSGVGAALSRLAAAESILKDWLQDPSACEVPDLRPAPAQAQQEEHAAKAESGMTEPWSAAVIPKGPITPDQALAGMARDPYAIPGFGGDIVRRDSKQPGLWQHIWGRLGRGSVKVQVEGEDWKRLEVLAQRLLDSYYPKAAPLTAQHAAHDAQLLSVLANINASLQGVQEAVAQGNAAASQATATASYEALNNNTAALEQISSALGSRTAQTAQADAATAAAIKQGLAQVSKEVLLARNSLDGRLGLLTTTIDKHAQTADATLSTAVQHGKSQLGCMHASLNKIAGHLQLQLCNIDEALSDLSPKLDAIAEAKQQGDPSSDYEDESEVESDDEAGAAAEVAGQLLSEQKLQTGELSGIKASLASICSSIERLGTHSGSSSSGSSSSGGGSSKLSSPEMELSSRMHKLSSSVDTATVYIRELPDRMGALERAAEDPAQAAASPEQAAGIEQLREELRARASNMELLEDRLDLLEETLDAHTHNNLEDKLVNLDSKLQDLLDKQAETFTKRITVLEDCKGDHLPAAQGQALQGGLEQVQQGLALLQDRTQALEQTTQDPAQAAAVQELKTDAQQLRQELHARASDTKSVDCRLDALEGDAVVQADLREQLDDLDIDLKKLLEQKTGTLDERVRVLELNRADYMHAAMGEDMHGRLGQAQQGLADLQERMGVQETVAQGSAQAAAVQELTAGMQQLRDDLRNMQSLDIRVDMLEDEAVTAEQLTTQLEEADTKLQDLLWEEVAILAERIKALEGRMPAAEALELQDSLYQVRQDLVKLQGQATRLDDRQDTLDHDHVHLNGRVSHLAWSAFKAASSVGSDSLAADSDDKTEPGSEGADTQAGAWADWVAHDLEGRRADLDGKEELAEASEGEDSFADAPQGAYDSDEDASEDGAAFDLSDAEEESAEEDSEEEMEEEEEEAFSVSYDEEGEEVPVEQTVRNVDIKFDYETDGKGTPAAVASDSSSRMAEAFKDKDDQWDPDLDLWRLSDDFDEDEEADAFVKDMKPAKGSVTSKSSRVPDNWPYTPTEGDGTVG